MKSVSELKENLKESVAISIKKKSEEHSRKHGREPNTVLCSDIDNQSAIIAALDNGDYLGSHAYILDLEEKNSQSYHHLALLSEELSRASIYSIRMNKHRWVSPPDCLSVVSYTKIGVDVWKRLQGGASLESFKYSKIECIDGNSCNHRFEPEKCRPECDAAGKAEKIDLTVLTFENLARYANANAVTKGFHSNPNGSPKKRNIGEALALIHSEVSEALEESRKNTDLHHTYYKEDGKPEGFLFEIADIFIRCGDLLGQAGLASKIEKAIKIKMEYNATRPRMHNKEF